MYITPRSYLTSGIAALGVGAIALAPIQPIPSQVALAPQRVVSELGVELAAAVDPITAWVDTFETTFANIGILGEFYMQKPFPLLQTIAANIATYAEEAADGNAGVIFEQIWGNIQTFFQAPWSPGKVATLTAACDGCEGTLDVPLGDNLTKAKPAAFGPGQNPQTPYDINLLLLQLAAGISITGPVETFEGLQSFGPIWEFLNSPYSGQLLGLVGPIVAPLVSLTNSFTAIGEYFEAGDIQSALFELINIPANMTNAFFNGGGFLDLTGIVADLLGGLPEQLEGARIGLNMGGLLHSVPANGDVNDPENLPTEWVYGAGFDSFAVLGEKAGDFFYDQPATGFPNGWFGNAIGLGQYLADQMLVTPAPPPAAEPPAETAAAIQAAPVDLAPAEAPAEESAPVVDAPAPVEESAPVEVVEESAPVVDDPAEVEAAVEAVEAAEVEAAEAAVEATEAPATAPANEASGTEAAGDQSDGDTGRAGSGRRGAR